MGQVLSVGPPLTLTQYDVEDVLEHCNHRCAQERGAGVPVAL